MTPKNSANLAFLMGELINEVFDITAKVYDILESSRRFKLRYGKGGEAETSGDKFYYSYGTALWHGKGERERNFSDKLNYSAFVVDHTLAETFAAALALGTTMESANLTLSSTGEMKMSGFALTQTFTGESKDVVTPSYAFMEGVYTAEIVASGLEFMAKGAQIGVEAAEKAKYQKQKKILEGIDG